MINLLVIKEVDYINYLRDEQLKLFFLSEVDNLIFYKAS